MGNKISNDICDEQDKFENPESFLSQNASFLELGPIKKLFTVNFDEIEILNEGLWKPNPCFPVEKYSIVKYRGKKLLMKHGDAKDILDRESLRIFSEKVREMKSLRHGNVLEEFFGCTLENIESMAKPKYGVLYEYLELGNVRHFCESRDEGFSESQKMRILYTVASTLDILDKNNIIHLDLKWDQFFLTEDVVPKLLDFGLENVMETFFATRMYTMKHNGTSQYLAPEVCLSSHYSSSAMVFSFGIMMYELICDDFYPYGKPDEIEFNVELKVALNPDFRPEIDKKMDVENKKRLEWLILLIKRCWDCDDSERPSFEEICKIIKENVVLSASDLNNPMIQVDIRERADFLKNGGFEISFGEEDEDCESRSSISGYSIDLKIGKEIYFHGLPKVLFV